MKGKNNFYSWVHLDLRNLNKYANGLTKSIINKNKKRSRTMVGEKWTSRQWKWNRMRNSQDYRIFNLTTIYDEVLIGRHEVVTITIDLNFWMPYIDCRLWAPAQYPYLSLSLFIVIWDNPTITGQKIHWHFRSMD